MKSLAFYGCRLAYIDLTNNTSLPSLRSQYTENNAHPIPIDAVEFSAVEEFPDDFDPDKVTNVRGANYADGVFTNITGDVTYAYDCGNGTTAGFKLVRTAV